MIASQVARPPDARIVAGEHACSLWWSQTPILDGRRTGFIGHWEDPPEETGAALLRAAARRLCDAGCEVAVGPIDGSTWHAHRVVVEDSGDPPFLREPTLRDAASFATAEFRRIATYRSTAVPLCGEGDEAVPGVRIRAFRSDAAERDLALLHALATEAFRDAYLYAPIDRASFLALYRPTLARVDPDLVLFAEHGGRPAGFVFALPEPDSRRVVIKTVAVCKSARGLGIGGALMRAVEGRAHARGCEEAVHALAHERNLSLRFSRDRGRLLRRYALFGRRLDR